MQAKSISVAAIAFAVSLCWQSAAAQASPDRKKDETLAAHVSDPAPPPLKVGVPIAAPASAPLPKTVAERKAETLEALRKGERVPAGHGSPGQAGT